MSKCCSSPRTLTGITRSVAGRVLGNARLGGSGGMVVERILLGVHMYLVYIVRRETGSLCWELISWET